MPSGASNASFAGSRNYSNARNNMDSKKKQEALSFQSNRSGGRYLDELTRVKELPGRKRQEDLGSSYMTGDNDESGLNADGSRLNFLEKHRGSSGVLKHNFSNSLFPLNESGIFEADSPQQSSRRHLKKDTWVKGKGLVSPRARPKEQASSDRSLSPDSKLARRKEENAKKLGLKRTRNTRNQIQRVSK